MSNAIVSLEGLINSVNENTIAKQENIGKFGGLTIKDLLKIGRFKTQTVEIWSGIEENKKNINRDSNKLDESCTFTPSLITKFLAETLTMIDGDKYEAEPLHLIEAVEPICMKEIDISLITTEPNMKSIKHLRSKRVVTAPSDVENAIEDEKYIMFIFDRPLILADDYYSRFMISDRCCVYDWRNKRLPKGFSNQFPYLEEVIIDLINFRLENPDMSEEEAINAMLGQVPSRYEQLIKTKEDAKKLEKATI